MLGRLTVEIDDCDLDTLEQLLIDAKLHLERLCEANNLGPAVITFSVDDN